MPKRLRPRHAEHISHLLTNVLSPRGVAYQNLYCDKGEFDKESPFAPYMTASMRAEGYNEDKIEAERRKYDDQASLAPLVLKRLEQVISRMEDHLSIRLNRDICVDSDMLAAEFECAIIDLVEDQMSDPTTIRDEDGWSLHPKRKWPFEKKSECTFEELIARLQVIRFECAHCLNAECEFRDPQIPVPDPWPEDSDEESEG